MKLTSRTTFLYWAIKMYDTIDYFNISSYNCKFIVQLMFDNFFFTKYREVHKYSGYGEDTYVEVQSTEISAH